MNKLLTIICLTILSWSTNAQVNRYMVFFTDKDNTTYSISRPEEFLSQRSIDRRLRQNISITSQDLPVVDSYILGISEQGADVFFQTKWLNGVLVQMDVSLINNLLQLNYVSNVVFVAPGDPLSYTQNIPQFADIEDLIIPSDGDLSTYTQNGMLGIDEMHADGFMGEGIWVAIFDTGFPGANTSKVFENCIEENRFVGYRDFIRNSGDPFQYYDHGTRVLSIIAGDYLEFQGSAPQASFVLCATEDDNSEYRIEEYNWLFAAEYADSLGVDLINTSLGYSYYFEIDSMNYIPEQLDGNSTLIAKAAQLALEKGMLLVTSAGNEGDLGLSSPADVENVLTVGSVNTSYQRASYSSVGPTSDGRLKPDVMALGDNVNTINENGQLSSASRGTSLSSPLITGLAAGIWQSNRNLSNLQLIDVIRNSGTRVYEPDTLVGYGVPSYKRIDVWEVLAVFDDIEPLLYPNPTYGNQLVVDLNGIHAAAIRIMDLSGKPILLLDKFEHGIMKIDISNLTNGKYILQVQSLHEIRTITFIKN